VLNLVVLQVLDELANGVVGAVDLVVNHFPRFNKFNFSGKISSASCRVESTT